MTFCHATVTASPHDKIYFQIGECFGYKELSY